MVHHYMQLVTYLMRTWRKVARNPEVEWFGSAVPNSSQGLQGYSTLTLSREARDVKRKLGKRGWHLGEPEQNNGAIWVRPPLDPEMVELWKI